MESSMRTYSVTWNVHHKVWATEHCEGILNFLEETEKNRNNVYAVIQHNSCLSILSWAGAQMCTCLPWNAVFFQQTNGIHLGKSSSYLWVRLMHAGPVLCVNIAVHLNMATSQPQTFETILTSRSHEVQHSIIMNWKGGPRGRANHWASVKHRWILRRYLLGIQPYFCSNFVTQMSEPSFYSWERITSIICRIPLFACLLMSC